MRFFRMLRNWVLPKARQRQSGAAETANQGTPNLSYVKGGHPFNYMGGTQSAMSELIEIGRRRRSRPS